MGKIRVRTIGDEETELQEKKEIKQKSEAKKANPTPKTVSIN